VRLVSMNTNELLAWEHSRAMMRPQFAREQVSDLDLEERHVQNMMNALNLMMQPSKWSEPLDLQVLFFRLTLDSATEFLFGQSVDSQLNLLPSYKHTQKVGVGPNSSAFAEAFDNGQMALATRARYQDRYWLVSPKGFRGACSTCHEFIDHYVRIALSKNLHPKNPASGEKERYIFLEALAAQTQDPLELRSQLLHILLAGRDTTASLLGWLFYCLARDPARYKKLRDIIIDEFGTYDNPADITFARMKSCKYLQNCNNEALRLVSASKSNFFPIPAVL
jgi:cytochrome P450